MAKDKGKTNVTIDVNQAIDQAESIAEKLWDGVTGDATNVVISVFNNTDWDLKILGGFQWQGKASQPAEDIAAGEGGGWMMHSNGADGSFSMQSWQMQWPGEYGNGPFLTVGELGYSVGAQSRMTALFQPTNYYGSGTQSEKDEALVLLDKGRSTGWTNSNMLQGPPGGAWFEIRTTITSKKGVTNGVTYVVTLNQMKG